MVNRSMICNLSKFLLKQDEAIQRRYRFVHRRLGKKKLRRYMAHDRDSTKWGQKALKLCIRLGIRTTHSLT